RAWKPVARVDEALLDRAHPCGEVRGEQRSNGWVGLVQLERDAADWTPVRAIGPDQRLPVAREQGEDALDRVDDALPRWLEQHGMNAVQVRVEHGDGHVLLAWKEVIETPGVDLRGLQDVGDARRGVSFLREQP